MMEKLKIFRFWLLLLAWLSAVLQIVLGRYFEPISVIGVTIFTVYIVLTLPYLKRDSLIIISFLLLLGVLIIPSMPDHETLLGAGRFMLIFAGLVPTMALVKHTAMTMPSVRKTQEALGELPPEASAAGLQLAGHAFGGVINTGTFAMLSAALPENSSLQRRKTAALAALRGMNSSAVWSPFFVAFAIGQSFIDAHSSWVAIGYGVLISFLFTLSCLFAFTPGLNLSILRSSLICLKPVSLRLLVVLVSVLGGALIFKLTALSAVVSVMPLLILIQFLRHPGNVSSILAKTTTSLKSTADDIVVISSAMLLGYLVTRTGGVALILEHFSTSASPAWVALITTPVVMMLASVIGIHPVISSTILLSIFSGSGSDADPALLMQSHLIGWAAGTMSSVASLSVITCTTLYEVSSRELAMGANLTAAFGLAFGGGVVLTLINLIIG
ncbi:hypothetical protein AB8880_06240 [Alphaproteobacteria bacterium LSUCC0684]